MKRLLTSIFLILLLPATLCAQESDASQAKAIFLQIERIKNISSPEEKIAATIRLAETVSTSSNSLAALLNETINLASSINRADLLAMLYVSAGRQDALNDSLPQSLLHLQKAEKLLTALNPDSALPVKKMLAETYLLTQQVEKSISYFKQIENDFKTQAATTAERVTNLNNLSNAYAQLNDSKKLQALFRESLRLAAGNAALKKNIEITYADNLSKINNTIEGNELYKSLIEGATVSEKERVHILSMLVINLVKLKSFKEIDFFYTQLQKALKTGFDETNKEEVWLAQAMFEEIKGHALKAKSMYLLLVNQKSLSRMAVEGVIRLASLFSTELKKDSAEKYFAIARKAAVTKSDKSLTHYFTQANQQHKEAFKNETGLVHSLNAALQKQDSQYRRELISATNELSLKYKLLETGQQVKEIRYQQQLQALKNKQLRQLTILLFTLLLLVCLIAVGGLYYFYQRKKQTARIHKTEMENMELKHRSDSMAALAKAQESERSRIANQLHDEIGTMLAVARLNISSVDGQLLLTDEAEDKLIIANKILNDVAQTIREMSHQLMPIALKQYGFKNALLQLISDINHSGKLFVEQIIVGFETPKLTDEFYTNCYRIIQELFQNIIKHAEATHAILQAIEHEDLICLVVEDNGKGMQKLNTADGQGIPLLKSRIAYLEGSLSIDSNPQGGTIVIVELPIQSKFLIAKEYAVAR